MEQDLVITLALFDIFRDEELKAALAFRGGTALHKLHLPPAVRYSEDIDLVQRQPGPIGPILDRLRRALGWIGPARSEIGEHPKLTFRFETDFRSEILAVDVEVARSVEVGLQIAGTPGIVLGSEADHIVPCERVHRSLGRGALTAMPVEVRDRIKFALAK